MGFSSNDNQHADGRHIQLNAYPPVKGGRDDTQPNSNEAIFITLNRQAHYLWINTVLGFNVLYLH